jgi:hypothetical protein
VLPSQPLKNMKVPELHEVALENTENPEKLKKHLLQTIDDSLNQLLGETVTQKIYRYLEEKHYIKREDIPNNLEGFQFTLKEIFGAGALVIEKTIMEKLYSRLSNANNKISLKYENKEQFNFPNYVNDLKSSNKTKTSLIL